MHEASQHTEDSLRPRTEHSSPLQPSEFGDGSVDEPEVDVAISGGLDALPHIDRLQAQLLHRLLAV